MAVWTKMSQCRSLPHGLFETQTASDGRKRHICTKLHGDKIIVGKWNAFRCNYLPWNDELEVLVVPLLSDIRLVWVEVTRGRPLPDDIIKTDDKIIVRIRPRTTSNCAVIKIVPDLWHIGWLIDDGRKCQYIHKGKLFNRKCDFEVLVQTTANVLRCEIKEIKYYIKKMTTEDIVKPEMVVSGHAENNSTLETEVSEEISYTYEESYDWGTIGGSEVEVGIQISAGPIPIISGTIGRHEEHALNTSRTISKTITANAKISIPPGRRAKISLIVVKGKYKIPFRAILQKHYSDGSSMQVEHQGVFECEAVLSHSVKFEDGNIEVSGSQSRLRTLRNLFRFKNLPNNDDRTTPTKARPTSNLYD